MTVLEKNESNFDWQVSWRGFFQLTANGGIMRSFNNQKDDMRKKCECVVYVNVSEVILKQL